MKHVIVVEFSFPYGHRLARYEGKCSRLHGHNARVEIALQREKLDEQGFVADFSTVKVLIKALLDRKYDHYMLLQHNDPLVSVLKAAGELFTVTDEPPTAENIAAMLLQDCIKMAVYGEFGEGVDVVGVRFFETDVCSALASV